MWPGLIIVTAGRRVALAGHLVLWTRAMSALVRARYASGARHAFAFREWIARDPRSAKLRSTVRAASSVSPSASMGAQSRGAVGSSAILLPRCGGRRCGVKREALEGCARVGLVSSAARTR